MRLLVLAVGTRMPRWVDEGFADYARRMPRHLPLELVAVRPEPRGEGRPLPAMLQAEAARLQAAVPAGCCRIALDERGNEYTTTAFAQWLARQTGEGRDLAFMIGGPDGLAPAILKGADLCLRLSAFTLPHALARVLLAEQLYRAASILGRHPYHRE
jgi:23S rRNA (pseudouridine1915-N3)-methyltransferase